MKTANVKARVKDIKAGVTLYTAHPVYGIDKTVVLGKPYLNSGTKSLFVKTKVFYSGGSYETENSLHDMGVTPGNSYNGRRTFFKLKHAEAWAEKWSKDLKFIQSQAEHEQWCSMLKDYEDYFDQE